MKVGISVNHRVHRIKKVHGPKNPGDIEYECGLWKKSGQEHVVTDIAPKNLKPPYSLCSRCFPGGKVPGKKRPGARKPKPALDDDEKTLDPLRDKDHDAEVALAKTCKAWAELLRFEVLNNAVAKNYETTWTGFEVLTPSEVLALVKANPVSGPAAYECARVHVEFYEAYCSKPRWRELVAKWKSGKRSSGDTSGGDCEHNVWRSLQLLERYRPTGSHDLERTLAEMKAEVLANRLPLEVYLPEARALQRKMGNQS